MVFNYHEEIAMKIVERTKREADARRDRRTFSRGSRNSAATPPPPPIVESVAVQVDPKPSTSNQQPRTSEKSSDQSRDSTDSKRSVAVARTIVPGPLAQRLFHPTFIPCYIVAFILLGVVILCIKLAAVVSLASLVSTGSRSHSTLYPPPLTKRLLAPEPNTTNPPRIVWEERDFDRSGSFEADEFSVCRESRT